MLPALAIELIEPADATEPSPRPAFRWRNKVALSAAARASTEGYRCRSVPRTPRLGEGCKSSQGKVLSLRLHCRNRTAVTARSMSELGTPRLGPGDARTSLGHLQLQEGVSCSRIPFLPTPSDTFNISLASEWGGDQSVPALPRCDLAGKDQLRQSGEQLPEKPGEVLLDLRDLEFIDSTGLRSDGLCGTGPRPTATRWPFSLCQSRSAGCSS